MTQVLLVTGGSRSIGAAAARLAATRGYAVGVNYRSDAQAADAVVAAIHEGGGKAVAIQGDMANEADVARVFAEVEQSLSRLTHLVYNAGMTGKRSRFAEVEGATLRAVFELNVLGACYAARAAIPRISVRTGGSGGVIVLLSSVAANLGASGECVWYAASKGAIDAMTIGLAKELAADQIRVNAVAPGLIATDIHEPQYLARAAPHVPMQRAGMPEEVAEAILYLLSDAASYVSGAVLRVGGGR